MIAITRFDVISSLAIGAEADIFIGLYITDGKGIVKLYDIEILHGIGYSCHAIPVVSCHASAEKAGKSGIPIAAGESLPKILILIRRFIGKKRYFHIPSVCWSKSM